MTTRGRLNLHHRGAFSDCRYALLCNPCHYIIHRLADFPPRDRPGRLHARTLAACQFRYNVIGSLKRITSRRYSRAGTCYPRLWPVARRFRDAALGRRSLTPSEMRALRRFDPITQKPLFLAALRLPDKLGGKHADHRR